MRSVDTAYLEALQSRGNLVPRDLITLWPRDRSTGVEQEIGLWDDSGTETFTVISGETFTHVERDYTGDGAILKMDTIPLVADLSVQTIQIQLALYHSVVTQIVRTYTPRNARVEIHRALLDPETYNVIAYPIPIFIGQVDDNPIDVGAVGSESKVTINLTSTVNELTITNTAKKSDESQKLRSGDRFRRYTTVAGDWEYWWGGKKESAD